MARIPPELVDMIVSKAYDNPPLLAVCGLVCRSWLASSRFHLLNGPVVLRPGNVNAFTQVLANPASTLPPYIRTLEISSGNLAGQSYDSQWLDPCIQVLADLPCVTEFLLENIHWGHMNPRTKTAILSGFQSLAHLEIRAAQFDSVLQVTQLVCSKPLLEILSFDDIAWKDPSFESPTTVPASLRSLRLSNCYKRDVLEWLVSHSSLPPIHHIQLGPVYPQDTVSIGRFLERLGANLFTLELEFSSLDAGGDAEDFCAHVDLSHNSALRACPSRQICSLFDLPVQQRHRLDPRARVAHLESVRDGVRRGNPRRGGAAARRRPHRLGESRQPVQPSPALSAPPRTVLLGDRERRHGRSSRTS
ncbi:hypothetical protein C8J57DRAFT_606449 [Mycena rebaudengoi]|nr:hypothetical protein C8J57DRAFT_606449 [Mycena rebaudengoi]